MFDLGIVYLLLGFMYDKRSYIGGPNVLYTGNCDYFLTMPEQFEKGKNLTVP